MIGIGEEKPMKGWGEEHMKCQISELKKTNLQTLVCQEKPDMRQC